MEDKAAARAEARRIRRAIPEETREAKGAVIAERVLALPELRGAKAVGCYASVHSEVPTRLLVRHLLARGAVVALPVLVAQRRAESGSAEAWGMRYARLDHPWGLAPGPMDIPEPREPRTEVDAASLDVIIVPGLRFGRDGSRLGNGGGHFDRVLAAHPHARRVGVAFAEQVVDALPVESHDADMDVLVTDTETLRFARVTT